MTTSKPKIGVFGWYMYGNFGDEIMAIMIARALKSHGYRPVCYRLPHYLAAAEEIETAETIDALTDGASACVLGGGGLLVTDAEAMTPAIATLDDELRQVAVHCTSRSIPVWAVSLGGAGAGRQMKLYPGLTQLLESGIVRGITLRLEKDRPLVDAFKIPSEHYPDIVFLAPDYWPCPPTHDARDLIATNRIERYWFGRRLIHFLDTFGPSVFGVEPRHLSTTNLEFSRRTHTPLVGHADRHVPYVTVQEFSTLLPRVRAIVSSKLHLGIFGMSYGAVFFSFGGKGKTHAQLRELGLESQILSTRDLPRWTSRLRNGFSEELETTARLVPDLRRRARGHVSALLAFLHAETGHGMLPGAGTAEQAASSSVDYRHGGTAA